MNPLKFYQQGDLLVIEEALPAAAIRLNHDGFFHNPITGSTHRVAHPVKSYQSGDDYYITCKQDFTIKHQKRAPLYLPPGTYKLYRVREYCPDTKSFKYL